MSESVFECEVRLVREEEGGYSVYVPRLPGVASQGESEADAVAAITEALEVALRSYRDAGSIPWETGEPPLSDETTRWVVVHL